MINEARKYVRSRLNAELAYSASVEHIIEQYANIIANIAYQFRMQPKWFSFSKNPILQNMVERHIQQMKQEIYDYILQYCILCNKKEEEDAVAWLEEEDYYQSLLNKLDEYAAMWYSEIEKHIAAALIVGKPVQDMIRGYNPKKPYTAEYYKKAEEFGSFGVDLRNHGKRGVGKTISAAHALTTLGRFIIEKFWMKEWADKWRKQNVTLYNVYRGSSYPCDLCDSMVGVQTEDNLPPYHPNCCCYAVPILND